MHGTSLTHSFPSPAVSYYGPTRGQVKFGPPQPHWIVERKNSFYLLWLFFFWDYRVCTCSLTILLFQFKFVLLILLSSYLFPNRQISFVERRMKPTAILFFRTQSPRHFEGGDWDQGGSCQRIHPLSPQEVKTQL